MKNKLNDYFSDPWNAWHLTKAELAYIFYSPIKHERYLPRYNTTSLYTAFTDIQCYDYKKISKRYRLVKRRHFHFLNSYRHHSPFPVYLSVLKSNGPKCYRHYPNSSCGVTLKSLNQNSETQLHLFTRFWMIVCIMVLILAAVHTNLTDRKQTKLSPFRYSKDFDRSSGNTQETALSNNNELSKATMSTTQSASFTNQRTVACNTDTRPLDQRVEEQLRLWLQNEKNEGFRDLSEICRRAINNTLVRQLVS